MTNLRRRFSRPTLALLLLLLVVTAWVLHLRQGSHQIEETTALGPGAVLGEPDRFSFIGPEDSIVVVRRGEEFWAIHPLLDRADPVFMNEVTRTARELKPRRVLGTVAGIAYGLDPVTRMVMLRNRAGGVWGLALGDTSPVASSLYVRRLESTAPVVMIELFGARKYFTPVLSALRDPVTAPLKAGPVDSISALIPGHVLRARRESRERWISLAPAGLRLDPSRINQVVQALRSPSIEGFETFGAARDRLGLDPPRAVWVLHQGSLAESVLVGNLTADGTHCVVLPAHRSGAAWLGGELHEALTGGWEAMADRHLLSIPAESIRVVQFLGEARAGSYEKSTSGWTREPGGRRVERRGALERELENLAALQWTRYPVATESPSAGARPLRLRLAGAAVCETLSLVPPRDSLGWASGSRPHLWGHVPALAWKTWRYRADHPE
jgi:hypothetical protein